MVAAGCDFSAGVSLLIRRGAKVNRRTLSEKDGSNLTGAPGGWQALHFACAAGSARCARNLVKAGADVNARTDSGQANIT